MSNNKETDAIVLDLFNKVKKRKAELSKVAKTKWLTSCTLQLSEGNVASNVNIQTVLDVKKLVDLYSFVLQKEDYSKIAQKELGLEVKSNLQGYPFADWKSDIQSRVEAIKFISKKEELTVLENRLDKLITQEQRRELELADIQKSMVE